MELDSNRMYTVLNAMENGKLFFENYKGTVSPITYCDIDNDKIIFKE